MPFRRFVHLFARVSVLVMLVSLGQAGLWSATPAGPSGAQPGPEEEQERSDESGRGLGSDAERDVSTRHARPPRPSPGFRLITRAELALGGRGAEVRRFPRPFQLHNAGHDRLQRLLI